VFRSGAPLCSAPRCTRSRAPPPPSLKTIEPHKLKALILEDLKYNGKSTMKALQQRLSEALPQDIQKNVYQMANAGDIQKTGAAKKRHYHVEAKKSN